jgi:hypothetical protein
LNKKKGGVMPTVEKVITDKGKEYLQMEQTYANFDPSVHEPVRGAAPQIPEYVEPSPVDRESFKVKKKDIEIQVSSFKDLDIEQKANPEVKPEEVVFDKVTGAVKHDGTKPRMDLIPPEAELAMGEMFRHGAAKYDDRNWEKGMDWGRVYASARRHLSKFWAGEDIDPDSGKPHLWCALCCVAMLTTYQDRGIGNDNRYKKPTK